MTVGKPLGKLPVCQGIEAAGCHLAFYRLCREIDDGVGVVVSMSPDSMR